MSEVSLETGLSREWLVTNGIGGYASGTVVGANTRTYHGLLVASLAPPWGRQVLLSKIDEELEVDGKTYQLGVNEYQDNTIHPKGYEFIKSFKLDLGIPVIEFEAGGVQIEKRVWMEHGQNTVYVRYSVLKASGEVRLRLRPFCAFRSYHGDQAQRTLAVSVIPNTPEIHINSGGFPHILKMSLSGESQFVASEDCYYHFLYRKEKERGLHCTEDLYTPGIFQARLKEGEEVTLAATCESDFPTNTKSALKREKKRRSILVKDIHSDFEKLLVMAADQFIVRMPEKDAERQCIIAGYHWFTDWGRDTMIALPGLLYGIKYFGLSRVALLQIAQNVHDGMIPNRITDDGYSEFNTADASLWFFETVRRYIELSGDQEILKPLLSKLQEIIEYHLTGVRYGIGVDQTDGLLRAGEPGTQLTWMDACVSGNPVTPRIGKPVEINALWYNALMLASSWGIKGVGETAKKCKQNFTKRFWNEDTGCLFDVVDGPEGDDPSIRPNQIIAVALPNSPLSPAIQKSVVDIVEKQLYTPFGLRTLSPEDARYRGIYGGSPTERDAAYHQGTVWPWLLGPFADAHFRVYRDKSRIADMLKPFRKHLKEAGIGSISEVFDGDPPHRPGGCIAQAWSVGELLRIYHEYCEETP